MRKFVTIAVLLAAAFCALCADANYKQVLVTPETNSVRVRLPRAGNK